MTILPIQGVALGCPIVDLSGCQNKLERGLFADVPSKAVGYLIDIGLRHRDGLVALCQFDNHAVLLFSNQFDILQIDQIAAVAAQHADAGIGAFNILH